MANYEIKFNKKNGWSYEEGDIPIESDYVELSDEEAQILVDLMNRKGTHNVSELGVEDSYPEIYNKLVETCNSIAWDIAIAEAAREAHYYDEEDTFLDKLQEYCESEYNYDESYGDFRRWLYLLIQPWSCAQLRELYDKAGIVLCWDVIDYFGIETYDYDVTIPQSIVERSNILK